MERYMKNKFLKISHSNRQKNARLQIYQFPTEVYEF